MYRKSSSIMTFLRRISLFGLNSLFLTDMGFQSLRRRAKHITCIVKYGQILSVLVIVHSDCHLLWRKGVS